MNRTWVVVAYDHDGDALASKEFRSTNAAQEYAFDILQEEPDKYAKVLIMESTSVFMNTKVPEAPTFVRTGPDYVHRDRLANGHDDGLPQLEYSGE